MALHVLHVAVSAKAPRGGWSWRHVPPKGRFMDGTGVEAYASPYRLRLHALVQGLRALPGGTEVQVVTTDPNTARLAEEWLPRWASEGFRRKNIESLDLVKELAVELQRLKVSFRLQPRRTGDPHAKDCSLHAKQVAAAMTVPERAPQGHAEVRGDVQVVAWTDGGSRKNPGPSGWGALLVHLSSGTTLTLRGGLEVATNNRMELMAIAEALAAFKQSTRVEVRTDSKFAISVCTEWRRGWKRRGWRKASGEAPVNLDVIQRLDTLLDHHDVVFTWVRGHCGEPGNEAADALCNQAIDAVLAGEDPGRRQRAPRPPFEVRAG